MENEVKNEVKNETVTNPTTEQTVTNPTPRPKRPYFRKPPPPPPFPEGSVLSFLFKGSTVLPSRFQEKPTKRPIKRTPKIPQVDVPVSTTSIEPKNKTPEEAAGKSPSPPPFGNESPEHIEKHVFFQTREPPTQIPVTAIVPFIPSQDAPPKDVLASTTPPSLEPILPIETPAQAKSPVKPRQNNTRKKSKLIGKRGKAPVHVLTLVVPPRLCRACATSFESDIAYEEHLQKSTLCVRWLALSSSAPLPSLPIHLFMEELLTRATTGEHPHQCRFCEEQFSSAAQHHYHFYQSRICNRFAHHELKSK